MGYEEIVDGRAWFDTVTDPMKYALFLYICIIISEIMRAENFQKFSRFWAIFWVGQNKPKCRLVLPPRPLQSDF